MTDKDIEAALAQKNTDDGGNAGENITEQDKLPEEGDVAEGNDIYRADLRLLKKRETAWTETHPRWKSLRVLLYGSLIVGLAGIIVVNFKFTVHSQMPLHVAIWTAALLIYVVAKKSYAICRPPFEKVYNARFEAGDEGLFYVYQRKLREITYYIDDEEIKEIIRDDEAHVVYIKGKAEMSSAGLQSNSKAGEKVAVDEIYCIVAFDEYDLDDLLAPYNELVINAPGTLRAKYIEAGKLPPM